MISSSRRTGWPGPLRQHPGGDQPGARLFQRIVVPLRCSPVILRAGRRAQRVQHRLHRRRAPGGQVALQPSRAAEGRPQPHRPVRETVLILIAGGVPAVQVLGQSGQIDQIRAPVRSRQELAVGVSADGLGQPARPVAEQPRPRLGHPPVRQRRGDQRVGLQPPHPRDLRSRGLAARLGLPRQPHPRGPVPVPLQASAGNAEGGAASSRAPPSAATRPPPAPAGSRPATRPATPTHRRGPGNPARPTATPAPAPHPPEPARTNATRNRVRRSRTSRTQERPGREPQDPPGQDQPGQDQPGQEHRRDCQCCPAARTRPPTGRPAPTRSPAAAPSAAAARPRPRHRTPRTQRQRPGSRPRRPRRQRTNPPRPRHPRGQPRECPSQDRSPPASLRHRKTARSLTRSHIR